MSEPSIDSIRGEPHVPWDSIGAEAEADPAEPQASTPQIESLGSLTPFCADATEPVIADEAGVADEPISVDMPVVSDDAPEEGATNARSVELPPVRSGGWTLPLLCGGVALVACCVLIPQADANRRLAYERAMLQMDLETIDRQIAVNSEFLKKVASDPALAERLAERQMKVIPEGTRVLELQHESSGNGMSPFQLVSVAPPAPLPPYKPVGGTIAGLCYDPHSRLYLMGAALAMIAVGLVLGYAPQK